MPIGKSPLFVKAIALLFACGLASTAQAETVTYTYDLQGRLTTALYDNGTCIAYSYDPSGNRISQTTTNMSAPETAVWGTGTWGCFSWSTTTSPASTSGKSGTKLPSGGNPQERSK